MEEGISGTEDKLEEIDPSTKENHKSNKSLTQNIQEMWDTVKRPKLRIICIEVGRRGSPAQRCRKHIQQNHQGKLSQSEEGHAHENKRSIPNTK